METLSMKAMLFWSQKMTVISDYMMNNAGDLTALGISDPTVLESASDPNSVDLWVIYYVLWKVTETQGAVESPETLTKSLSFLIYLSDT